jgi:putative FmdB family regulatory protein
MPTYEYLCKECSHRFEQWQKMIDEPLKVCSTCGGPLRRVYYPAGIVFKGSGFYKTDHSNGAEGATSSDAQASKGEGGTTTAAQESNASSEQKSSSSSAESGQSSPKSAGAPQSEKKATAPAPK